MLQMNYLYGCNCLKDSQCLKGRATYAKKFRGIIDSHVRGKHLQLITHSEKM